MTISCIIYTVHHKKQILIHYRHGLPGNGQQLAETWDVIHKTESAWYNVSFSFPSENDRVNDTGNMYTQFGEVCARGFEIRSRTDRHTETLILIHVTFPQLFPASLLDAYSARGCKVERGLTSHQTHHRSYRGRVFTGQLPQPTVSRHWRTMGPEG